MPKIANYKAGNIILKNDTTKFISNIMIYNKDGKEMISKYRFQNSYPAGQEIKLGAFRCTDDLIVKFKMDGKTYVYKQNDYVKPIFKESVTLWTESFLLVRAQRSPFLCPLIRIRRRQDMGNACTRFRHVAISKGPFHEVLRLSRLWLHLVVGHHRLVLLFYYDLIVIHRLSKDSGNTTYFLQFFHKCFVSLCHQHVIFILHG